jgi:hypothetical protein
MKRTGRGEGRREITGNIEDAKKERRGEGREGAGQGRLGREKKPKCIL